MNPYKLKHRFFNYSKSLSKLKSLIDSKDCNLLNDIERDSLIKRFELTFELSWNILKDFLEIQGETELLGSRNTFKIAFQRGIIHNGETWMEMIESRILAAHTYDEENAIEIAKLIYSDYIKLFDELKSFIEERIERI